MTKDMAMVSLVTSSLAKSFIEGSLLMT